MDSGPFYGFDHEQGDNLKDGKKKRSITIVVTALNEEANLTGSLTEILEAVGDKFESYEIIVVDDGSTDRTGEIADEFARKNPNIHVTHHRKNRGLGYSVSRSYRRARKEYVMQYAGDNVLEKKSLELMLQKVGEADLVIPYVENPGHRPILRRAISRLYVIILNFLFGLKLKYFNAGVIYKTDSVKVKSGRAQTHGFAAAAEILIRVIRGGNSYVEVPAQYRERRSGKSTALRLQNFLDVARAFSQLWWELNIQHKDPMNPPSGRRNK